MKIIKIFRMIFKMIKCNNCVLIHWDDKMIKYDCIEDITCHQTLYLSDCLKELVQQEYALYKTEEIIKNTCE